MIIFYICLTVLQLFPRKELGKSWLRQKVRRKPASTLQEPRKPLERVENSCRPQRRFQRISCSLSCGQICLEPLSLSKPCFRRAMSRASLPVVTSIQSFHLAVASGRIRPYNLPTRCWTGKDDGLPPTREAGGAIAVLTPPPPVNK